MRINLTCGDRPITYDYLDEIVAIQLSREMLAEEATEGSRARLRANRVRNEARGDLLPLSRTGAWQFEKAGWIFVEARPPLADAAITRHKLEGMAAVRPVLVDSGGNTLIGTELVYVRVDPDLTTDEALSRLRADGLERPRPLGFCANLFEATLPPGRPFLDTVAELQDKDWYMFAEPSFLQIITGRQSPNDPEFGRQWHHHNEGTGGGKRGADISSLAAWATTSGDGIRIAIIDNGMQVDHPDLSTGIIFGGHFTCDAKGQPTFICYRPGQEFPDRAHGTLCMGMAGARKNNHEGGCGSAPAADLIPIACATDQVGTQETLAKAIAFAANPATQACDIPRERGAHIIACSLGPQTGEWQICSVLDCAIREAARIGRGGLGVPIFWAVQNKNVPIARDQVCSHDDVIAVGQSTYRDVRVEGAFGDKLEFLAPGFRVLSTTSGSGYDIDDGASYACPLAAGVAALVLSVRSGLTRHQILEVLRRCCDKIGEESTTYVEGRHPRYGYGRINAARAVQEALAIP